MKKILTLLSSLIFTVFVFTSANSAGDEEAIKKLSSFKKTVWWSQKNSKRRRTKNKGSNTRVVSTNANRNRISYVR